MGVPMGVPAASAGDDVLALLFTQLAPRLANDEHRQLLRALLRRLTEGGAEAVKAEVRERLRHVLRETG